MARRPRRDHPDTWHHVMNRGLAHRTIFETDRDRRFFLSLLAREVRAGRLEIHAYCLLLNHFHMLVLSRKGELAKAMHRIQSRYARYFNRTRRRDGPLYKGRYLSSFVDTLAYRRKVVAYIHDNPIEAGETTQPWGYRWSSAFDLAARGRQPPRWLETGWVEEEIMRRGAGDRDRAQGLLKAFPSRPGDAELRQWIEDRLRRGLYSEREHDATLEHAGSAAVVGWALRNAQLADGTRPWRPVSPPNLVERILQRRAPAVRRLLGRAIHRAERAWNSLRAGLLRLLAGCTQREISMRLGRHASTICRDIQNHVARLRRDPTYADLASRLTRNVLAQLE